MAHATERYHSLDFLRAAAMLLGILLHGAISFLTTPIPFWAARDAESSPAADLLIFIVHDFRMQTFFLLAGFFGCLLHERYGIAGLLKHRMQRILLPFGLGLVLIGPTLQAVWLLGDASALRFLGLQQDVDRPPFERMLAHFTSGRFLQQLPLFHLWFLWFLVLFFVGMIPLLLIGNWLEQTTAGEAGRRLFRKLLTMPGRSIVLAGLTLPLVWPNKVWGMIDTQESWLPRWHIAAYYFLFFVFGWLTWKQRDLLPAFARRWPAALLIANLAVMPVMLKMLFESMNALLGKEPLPGWERKLAICWLGALYTWLMIGGLIGAFQHFLQRERGWVRYLADASYWCYLWHLTLIVGMQILLASAPIPGLMKFILIVGLPMALLLGTYEWCVRYTVIGTLLNGRRHRPVPQAVPGSETVAAIPAESQQQTGAV